MPQDWHWFIQGFKHYPRALGSSQQHVLEVLLEKPVSTRKIKSAGTTAMAKCWKHLLQWARQAAVAYDRCYGMTGDVLVAWPPCGHPYNTSSNSCKHPCCVPWRIQSHPRTLGGKSSGIRLQKTIVPQLHPCTGLRSCVKRAEESESLAGWTLLAERHLVPLL